MLAWRFLGAALLSALLLPACGDDEMPPPPPVDTGPGRDTGPVDTGPRPDGAPDGGPDSTTGDTSIGDTGTPVTGDCRVTETLDIHSEPGGFGVAELSAGTGADGFMVGYAVTRGGQEDYYIRHVPTSGTTIGAEQNVSNLPGTAFDQAGAGAITGLGTGWLVLWSDNRVLPGDTLRGINLHAATTSAGGASPSAPVAVTGEIDVRNRRPAVHMTADGYLVLYSRLESGFGAVDTIHRTTLGPDGAPSGTSAAISGLTNITRVSLGALTDGVAAAWVEDADSSGTTRDVKLVAMDRDGTPRGTPVTVTGMPNAAGIADYAGVIDGGGVVYDYRVAGARFDVRYRAIDADGNTASPPTSLVPLGEQGRAPSIGILSGNALVAYRGLNRMDEAAVHLVVADGFGTEIARTTVATLSDWMNGEVHVLLAPAGQGLVIWDDVAGGSWNLRGARIDCTEETP